MSEHRWDDVVPRPAVRLRVAPGRPRWADLLAPVVPASRKVPGAGKRAAVRLGPAAPVVDLDPGLVGRAMSLPADRRNMLRAEICRRASSGGQNRREADPDSWIGLFLLEQEKR